MGIKEMEGLHGGELIWYVHRKYKISPEDVICFDNLVSPIFPDFPFPPRFIVKNYSDKDCNELKELIADRCKVKKENIILTNGSTELIYLATKIFGQTVQLPVPTYSEYELAVKKYNGKPCFTKDYSSINASLMFICNPNNPTGKLIERDNLEKILKGISLNTKVFLDEAYMRFVSTQKSYSMAPSIDDYNNLIVSQTLTKFYGIPSLRLGWGIAPIDTIEKLKKHKIPMTIGGLTVYYAQEFMQNIEYEKKAIALIERERDRLFKELEGINWLRVQPTDANYFLIEIQGKLTSTKLFETLAKRGILIRDCSNIPGLNNKYIRVAIKTEEENNILIEELKKIEI